MSYFQMLDSQRIMELFDNVLKHDILLNNIPEEAIKLGIECMAHVYKGETIGLKSQRSMIADYTDVAHRCAYLHKYAAFHTAMVRDMLRTAINENFDFFYHLVFSSDRFRLCSLGGGPGTDVIGALAALHGAFCYFDTSVTVVDYMVDWCYSFESILKELGSGLYGAFGNNMSYFLNWWYVGANLLKTFKPEVEEALSTASLVTMIKFASAAACQDTQTMIKKIFLSMKPGAALLFIDNDGGGFHQLMVNAAIEYNFISIFGPHRRQNYTNEFMKIKRFGYFSCFKTTLTIHILQKPDSFSPNSYIPQIRLSPLLGSPPTPFLYRPQSPKNIIASRIATPGTNNVVNSPTETSTPQPGSSKISKRSKGCFPIKIKHFRHHLAKRYNNVKSRAREVFRSVNRKAHPIFRL